MTRPAKIRMSAVATVVVVVWSTAASAADFFWTSGDFVTGGTAPEPLSSGNTLFIQSGGTKRFVGSTFTNQGLVRWQADALQGGNSASVSNSGTWQSESDANSMTWNFGGRPTFTNTGTYSKTSGVVTNVGNWNFVNNGGLISAQAGSIVFNGDANAFNAGSRFSGAGQVRISGPSAFNGMFLADNLVLAGGSHAGTGAILSGGAGLSNGLLGWSGGDLTGNWAISNGATVTASGAATKRQVGSAITNDGTFRWSTTTALQGGNSSSFTNNALTEVTESAAFTWNYGGQHAFVNNATGTVRATNSATLTFGQLALTSNGGLFEAHAGSAMVYGGDSNRFNGGTRFVGDQRMTGTSTFVGQIESDNLRLVGGTQLGGDGSPGSKATLAGAVSWEGGDLQRKWEIKAGATVTASGAATKRQVGSAITNDGTFRWSTTTALQGGNSSSFTNNALTEVTESAAFTWNYGGQHAFVNNATGTVRVTNSATLTFGQLALTSNGGLFEAHAGSAMVYGGDSNRFNGGTRFVGDQRMTGTSTFVGQIESDNLRLVGGTQLGGDGSPGSKATLAGAVSWEGGDLQRKWEIKAGATVTASGAATKRQVGSAITNDGTFRWSTTTTLQGGNSSVFTNNGVFDVRADADASWNFGGQAALVNNGLFVKSAGAGETSLSTLALTNNGTIDVRSGSVKLPTNFTNHGTLTGSGSFALGGALTNAGHVAPGASPGTLTISGNYAQSAAGFLDVELNALGNTDLLMVSGTAGLNGTLALHCFGACSFAVGDQFVILDSVGNLTGTFSAMTMSGFATGNFLPIYDTDGDRVLLRVTQNVVAVPEPETYAMLLAGLGLLALAARRQERIAA